MGRRKEKKKMPDTVHLSLDIEVDELAEQLGQAMSRDDAIALVKALDEQMQEWDFTLALYEHFAKLKKDYDAEEAEDQQKAVQKHPCATCGTILNEKGFCKNTLCITYNPADQDPPIRNAACATCALPVDDDGFCQNADCPRSNEQEDP